MVLFLGLLLLMFMCKCAFVLIREKKRHKAQEIELSRIQNSHKPAVSMHELLLTDKKGIVKL